MVPEVRWVTHEVCHADICRSMIRDKPFIPGVLCVASFTVHINFSACRIEQAVVSHGSMQYRTNLLRATFPNVDEIINA